jgi:hypothetical protein
MMTGCKRRKPGYHLVELTDWPRFRQRQGKQRETWCRAHGCQVAQVDREGSMPDRLCWHERAIEMHPFDETVDAQHLDPIPRWLHDRSVVSNPDEHPARGRRKSRANSRDELAFCEVTYPHSTCDS